MKIIDKIILNIYSLIILIESIIVILLIFGWAKIEAIIYIIKDMLNNNIAYNILFGISVVFIILSIKAMLFKNSRDKIDLVETRRKDKMGEGVLIENEDGKLLISKETIERLANSVVNNYDNIQDARTKVIIYNKNEITILIELQILQNTIIKDLNANLQLRIKDIIKEEKAEKDAKEAKYSAEEHKVDNAVGRTIADVEQELILKTLQDVSGNRTKAAEILGITVRTLRNKLNEYRDAGIDVEEYLK